MRPLIYAIPLALLTVAALDAPARAAPSGVGLGVAAGVALPDSKLDFKPAFNWGFYVDIPLISTFHISPSTLVYNLNKSDLGLRAAATDVSLNFKFMVPLGRMELFGGVTAGITSAQYIDAHVGLLGGASFRLVSNIDVFAQANYRIIISGDENIRDLMLYAGPLFRFY